MAQKTAVQWLMELWENQEPYERFILPEQFEEAKEMEKQQIKDAFDDSELHNTGNENCSEIYYNYTYKK